MTDFDPDGLAQALLADNSYVTIATAATDGSPWATPVWFAPRGLELFVWASKPGARHSRNIAENPRVSLVVFDSSRAPGEGSALYISARAEPAIGDAFDESLGIYNARSLTRGLPEWTAAQLSAPAKHRLYRAQALEAFVLDDHDERIRVGWHEQRRPQGL